MKLVNDLLNEVITNLNIELKINGVELVDGGYKCYTLNTHYLRPLEEFNVNGVTYTVESFVYNSYLIVSGSTPIAPGTYTLNNPSFKHGKLKQTSAEILAQNQVRANKLVMPLVWMFELSPRQTPSEVNSMLESAGNVKLFFMNSADYENFTTADHFTNVIQPMSNLVDLFLKRLKKHNRVGKAYISNRIEHAKFTNDNGESAGEGKNILPMRLSGIEVELSLPINICLNCPTVELPEGEGGAFSGAFSSAFNRN